jgi:hypothetical protein
MRSQKSQQPALLEKKTQGKYIANSIIKHLDAAKKDKILIEFVDELEVCLRPHIASLIYKLENSELSEEELDRILNGLLRQLWKTLAIREVSLMRDQENMEIRKNKQEVVCCCSIF